MGLPVRQLYTLTLTAEPYCWNICRLYSDAIKIRTVCSEKHIKRWYVYAVLH